LFHFIPTPVFVSFCLVLETEDDFTAKGTARQSRNQNDKTLLGW